MREWSPDAAGDPVMHPYPAPRGEADAATRRLDRGWGGSHPPRLHAGSGGEHDLEPVVPACRPRARARGRAVHRCACARPAQRVRTRGLVRGVRPRSGAVSHLPDTVRVLPPGGSAPPPDHDGGRLRVRGGVTQVPSSQAPLRGEDPNPSREAAGRPLRRFRASRDNVPGGSFQSSQRQPLAEASRHHPRAHQSPWIHPEGVLPGVMPAAPSDPKRRIRSATDLATP